MEQPEESRQDQAVTGKCHWHPDTETGLSCSQCGKYVCTNCMVQASVGIRCRECGKAVRLPTYDVSKIYYARAVGVALGVAIVGGILWALLNNIFFGIPFLPGLIAVGVGYGAGELMSLSVNRKRSMGLAWLAGGAVVAAFFVNRLVLFGTLGLPLGFGIGFWGLLLIVIGVTFAVQRVRP